MPPRSAKMNRFIFGFQRRVWWPKWTPASSKSFMETTGTAFLSVVVGTTGGPREEPAQDLQLSAGTASRASAAGSGTEARSRVATAVQLSAVRGVENVRGQAASRARLRRERRRRDRARVVFGPADVPRRLLELQVPSGLAPARVAAGRGPAPLRRLSRQ